MDNEDKTLEKEATLTYALEYIFSHLISTITDLIIELIYFFFIKKTNKNFEENPKILNISSFFIVVNLMGF